MLAEDVIENLKKYRDRNCIHEGITVFDADPRWRKVLMDEAIKLIEKQQKEIEELKAEKERTEENFSDYVAMKQEEQKAENNRNDMKNL